MTYCRWSSSVVVHRASSVNNFLQVLLLENCKANCYHFFGISASRIRGIYTVKYITLLPTASWAGPNMLKRSYLHKCSLLPQMWEKNKIHGYDFHEILYHNCYSHVPWVRLGALRQGQYNHIVNMYKILKNLLYSHSYSVFD